MRMIANRASSFEGKCTYNAAVLSPAPVPISRVVVASNPCLAKQATAEVSRLRATGGYSGPQNSSSISPDNAADGRDPVAALSDLVRGLVSRAARHPTIARVCQYELSALTPEHYREIAAMRKGITDVFRFAVSRGLAAGLFDVDDVNLVVRAILSLGVDLVRWYRLDGPDSPETLGEAYVKLALRMLGAPK